MTIIWILSGEFLLALDEATSALDSLTEEDMMIPLKPDTLRDTMACGTQLRYFLSFLNDKKRQFHNLKDDLWFAVTP